MVGCLLVWGLFRLFSTFYFLIIFKLKHTLEEITESSGTHIHNKKLFYDLLPQNLKHVPSQLFLPKHNGFLGLVTITLAP